MKTTMAQILLKQIFFDNTRPFVKGDLCAYKEPIILQDTHNFTAFFFCYTITLCNFALFRS